MDPEVLDALLADLQSADEEAQNSAHTELLFLLEDLQGELLEEDHAKALYRIAYDLALLPEHSAEESLELLALSRFGARLLSDTVRQARVVYRQTTLLIQEGRLGAASGLIEEALNELDHWRTRPFFLHQKAEVKWRLGEYKEALRQLEETDALLEAPEQGPGWESVAWQSATTRHKILLSLGLPDQAQPGIEQQLQQAREFSGQDLRHANQFVAAFINAVDLALCVEDFWRAEQLVEEFLGHGLIVQQRPLAHVQFLLQRAIAWWEQGRQDPARRQRARAQLEDVLSRAASSSRIRTHAELTLAELELVEGNRQVALSLLQETRRRLSDDFRRPLQWSSRDVRRLVTLEGRESLLRGQPSKGLLEQARSDLGQAFQSILASWADSPERQGGIGFLQSSDRRAVLSELIAVTLAAGGSAEDALQPLLQAQSMGSRTRGEAQPVPRLESLQERLILPHHGIVVFLTGPARSHVFAMEKKALHHFDLAARDVIEPLRVEYLALLRSENARSPSTSLEGERVGRERRLAQGLARVLLPGELQDRIRSWRALSIVGSDLLGGTPLEWLPCGTDWPYLGLQVDVDYLPSLPYGDLLWRQKQLTLKGPDKGLLLIGGTPAPRDAGEGRTRLEFPRELQEQLTASYRGGSTVLTAPTRREVLDSPWQEFQSLQFLVHGIRGQTQEIPMGMQLEPELEDDGALFVTDFQHQRMPELVLLTFCGSASGPVRRGDPGAADLSGVFLSSGSQAVLFSHSDLPYRWTAEWSVYFHRHLADGLTPAQALRQARLDFLRDRPEDGPFRLGLIQLVGLGQMPLGRATITKPESTSTVWVAGAFLAGLALAMAIRVRRGTPV